MVQKWFIMLCKLANGNISENVILIRNTAECSFFCPIGKCDWYCWPRTRETFFSTWPTHLPLCSSSPSLTSRRTASLYPGIYEPLIIKPKPCHIFTEKKFSVRSFFLGDSFVSFFAPSSHWPRAFPREETFQLVGAFHQFFLKAGTAPGGGCLPRSVSLAGSAFQPLRPVSRQLSTDSGLLALDAGIEQAPARISLPPHILFLICPVQSVCCESNLCEALQSDGWLISLSACCSWTGPTVASPSHLSSNEVKEVMLVMQLAIIMATTWSTHAEAESLGMGYAGAPKPSGE